MPTELELDRGLVVQLERYGATRMHRLATTLSVTTDDALAADLGKRSECEGENLEGLAVAHACEVERVPCAFVLAATNRAGTRGRSDWLKHHPKAARDTARTVLSYLQAGAPRGVQ
jgi:nucleoside phosphorylase